MSEGAQFRELIFIRPILKEKMWGGTRISEFGIAFSSSHVGECWAVSAHPCGDCTAVSSQLGEQKLSELWKNHHELFGAEKSGPFPLMVKIIDAAQDLSLQVHPDDEYAGIHENGSLGKTECWYVLDAKKDASLIIGHNASSKAEARKLIEEKKWAEFIREVPVRKGDFFFIEPGTVHAIKNGILVLETQQSSDVTYRLYDYGRLCDGKPRELHIQQSLDVISAPFKDYAPPMLGLETVNRSMKKLAGCTFFTVWKADICGAETVVQDQNYMIVTVIEGSGFADEQKIAKGSSFIIPSAYGSVRFSGTMQLIISSS